MKPLIILGLITLLGAGCGKKTEAETSKVESPKILSIEETTCYRINGKLDFDGISCNGLFMRTMTFVQGRLDSGDAKESCLAIKYTAESKDFFGECLYVSATSTNAEIVSSMATALKEQKEAKEFRDQQYTSEREKETQRISELEKLIK